MRHSTSKLFNKSANSIPSSRENNKSANSIPSSRENNKSANSIPSSREKTEKFDVVHGLKRLFKIPIRAHLSFLPRASLSAKL
jgi:hypothetical protein